MAKYYSPGFLLPEIEALPGQQDYPALEYQYLKASLQ
jgi:hypothetical protein